MNMPAAIVTSRLVHRYGERVALAGIDLTIEAGEIFAILGPNGGGKSTLFRLLSTLIGVQQGSASVLGLDVTGQTGDVRRLIGVVFQAAALDRKLTVLENLRHQGHLYGLAGAPLRHRSLELLNRFGVLDRQHERIESLSGGLRRRVELAKGLLHAPQVLLLDEPSTGLDPGARGELWQYLREVRKDQGVTVVLTTHLLEEGEKADRLAILDRGKVVAQGAPDDLRSALGGDTLSIESAEPQLLAADIQTRFALPVSVIEGAVRLHQPNAHQLVPRLVEAYAGRLESITLGRPSLEDVFVAHTGHRFYAAGEGRAEGGGRRAEVDQFSAASVHGPSVSLPIGTSESAADLSPAPRPSPLNPHPSPLVPRPSPRLVVQTLTGRELVRFFRQRNRVVGAVGQPILFWVLFSASLGPSFRLPGIKGSQLTYADYFFPGTLALILLFTAIFATISIIEDRREGFLQSVLVAPAPRWALVLGKLLGGTLIALAQGLLFLALGYFVGFTFGIWGLMSVLAFMFVLAFALTGLGFMIAWRLDSTQGFHAIMSLVLMPMWLLSGAFFPADSGGRPGAVVMAWIMRLNPLTYGVAGLRRLMYTGNFDDKLLAGLPSLGTCWAVTITFAALAMLLSWHIAGKRTTGDLL